MSAPAPMEAVLVAQLPDGVKLPLPPRSAYLLRGEVRHLWEHRFAAHDARRFSITLRSLSERGLRTLRSPPPASAPPSAR